MGKQKTKSIGEKIIICFLLAIMLINQASVICTQAVQYIQENFEMPELPNLFNADDAEEEPEEETNSDGSISVFSETNPDVQVGVFTGTEFSASLREDGTVWAWGRNNYGQLGQGNTDTYTDLVQVKDATGESVLKNIVKIAVYSSHVLALDSEGFVWSWGYNNYGQLGINSYGTNGLFPAKVLKTAEEEDYLTNIADIAIGEGSSMALDTNGKVYFWGYDGYGQSGMVGTSTRRLLPVQPNVEGVTKIAMGRYSSYIIKDDNTLWGAGYNVTGELGIGTNTSVTSYTQVKDVDGVEGLQNVLDVSGGYSHAVIRTTDGIYATGDNAKGELGIGDTTNKNLPNLVLGTDGTGKLENIKQVKAGYMSSFAIDEAGKVYSWGYNNQGQLGVATQIDVKIPTQMLNAENMLQLSSSYEANSFTSMMDTRGYLYTTGYNDTYNKSGRYLTTVQRDITPIYPTYLYAGNENTSIDVNENLDIDLKIHEGFSVYNKNYLQNVTYTSLDTSIATVTNSGKVTGVGYGTVGIEAKDVTNNLTGIIYIAVANENNVTREDIQAGTNHTVVLKEDGTVWAWGYNNYGQLGNGTIGATITDYPTQVKNYTGEGFLTNIVQISTSYDHTLAVDANGNVWAWGLGTYGRLGHNLATSSGLPVKVYDASGIGYLENIVEVSAGQYHSMARDKDGNVYSWGYNQYAYLGTGNTTQYNVPYKITTITDIISIAAGNVNSYAVKSDGTVYSWGRNSNGANGNNLTTTATVTVPTQVNGLNNTGKLSNGQKVVSTNAGAMVLTNDGCVYVWGGAHYSGNGTTTTNIAYPVQVKLNSTTVLEDIVEIYGGSAKYAKDSNGNIYGWADNTLGQLGNGTVANQAYPVKPLNENGESIQNIRKIAVNRSTGNVMYINASGEILSSGANNTYNIAGTYEGSYNTNVVKSFRPEIFSNDNEKIIKVGDSFDINYEYTKGFRLHGENKIGTVKYETSDSEVLTVNPSGKVTAAGYGKAYINISDETNNLYTRIYITVLKNDEIAYPDIAVGTGFIVALKSDGTVWAWGSNTYGQMGNNNTLITGTPTQVLAGEQGTGFLQNIVKIAVGNNHILALDTDGNVYAWGLGTSGQLRY